MTLEEQFAEQENRRIQAENKRIEVSKPIPQQPPNVETLLINHTLANGKGTLVLTDVNALNEVLKETMNWYNNEITKVREKLQYVVEDAQQNYTTVAKYVEEINTSNNTITDLFKRILDAIEKSHPNDALEREVLIKINKEL